MTANTEAQQPHVAVPPPGRTSAYTERLSTWLPPDIGQRLRHVAVMRRQRLNRVLAEILDLALPTSAELADQVKGHATDEH
jgi:hypothetical protein